MNAPENSSEDLNWGINHNNSHHLSAANDDVAEGIADDSSLGFLSMQLDELDVELGEVDLRRRHPR